MLRGQADNMNEGSWLDYFHDILGHIFFWSNTLCLHVQLPKIFFDSHKEIGSIFFSFSKISDPHSLSFDKDIPLFTWLKGDTSTSPVLHVTWWLASVREPMSIKRGLTAFLAQCGQGPVFQERLEIWTFMWHYLLF